MKTALFFFAGTAATANAFTSSLRPPGTVLSVTTSVLHCITGSNTKIEDVSDRKQFLISTIGSCLASAGWLVQSRAVFAAGRATLEQSYERYVPRIRAGGEFYGVELKKLVASSDWQGIKSALQEVPDRKKEDLRKPDAGVAERARQAGQFSDARVLTAADLYAGAFSGNNALSAKTKKMRASIEKVRQAVQGMTSVSRQALGEEGGGGFLGLGAKKPNPKELKKQLIEYYVAGGNAWNEYVAAANEDLALQFDRLKFISG
jgi:hypothetical protein